MRKVKAARTPQEGITWCEELFIEIIHAQTLGVPSSRKKHGEKGALLQLEQRNDSIDFVPLINKAFGGNVAATHKLATSVPDRVRGQVAYCLWADGVRGGALRAAINHAWTFDHRWLLAAFHCGD